MTSFSLTSSSLTSSSLGQRNRSLSNKQNRSNGLVETTLVEWTGQRPGRKDGLNHSGPCALRGGPTVPAGQTGLVKTAGQNGWSKRAGQNLVFRSTPSPAPSAVGEGCHEPPLPRARRHVHTDTFTQTRSHTQWSAGVESACVGTGYLLYSLSLTFSHV